MSISRLWLRCLAIAALSPQAGDAAAPTMARDFVFDSRLDPLTLNVDDKSIPAIVVYTGDDSGELQNKASPDGNYIRSIELIVEITIGTFDSVVENGEAHRAFAVPVVDAQLEARLDIFEAQVRAALLKSQHRSMTAAFLTYVKYVHKVQSHAMRDETGNNKFASRILTFVCEVNDDCGPVYALNAPPEEHFNLSGFPGEPWLGPMLTAMLNDPSSTEVVNLLAGNFNSAIILPLLSRIGLRVDAIDPEADPNLLAQQGKTQGPDGRIELEAMWNSNEH